METDLIQGDGHHALFPHLVAEAGSIVLHVSNNMNEVKKGDEDSEDGEEEGGSAAAKESEEISRKDAEKPKTHRIEEKYTQRRETTTERG